MTATPHRSVRASILLAALTASLMAACGSTPAATTPSATASAVGSPSSTPGLATSSPAVVSTPAASPAATQPLPPTPDQSSSVAKAIFPAVSGGYLECDNGAAHATACPISSRLAAQLALYASNYAAQCAAGCGGALLFIRDQCGPFPTEDVSNVQNGAIALECGAHG